MKPGCYECVHRGSVPGSAHSSCQHPATKAVHEDPMMSIIGLFGRRSGVTVLPSEAQKQLHIEAARPGIVNGWFIWPVNFDPVWLERCDGFTAKAAAEVQT